MTRVNLTQKIVEATPLPLGRKTWIISISACPDLCWAFHRAAPKAGTPFIVITVVLDASTIGRYPVIALDDARNRAREALCSVSRGIDPARAWS